MGDKVKLGLALSGGGARGLAHIGVLKALEANDIQVDYLAGTSMGGVVAAAYASGMQTTQIEEIASNFSNSRHILKLVDPSIPGAGIFRGNHLLKFFKEYIGDMQFEQLKIPLGLVAVDIKTGNEIHLFEGPVAEALRATVSVPGLLDPLDHDEQRLVDGGLLNNLPVDVAYQMGADVVLAVDVMAGATDTSYAQILGEKPLLPSKIRGMVAVLGDSLNILIKEQYKSRLRQFPPAFLLEPKIPPEISVVSGYNRAEELIAEGMATTEPILDQLKEKLASIK
jgi:NTE family protein